SLILAALQLQFPENEFFIHVLPFLIIQTTAQRHSYLSELALVIMARGLAHQSLGVKILLYGEQYLVRVHRFDEIIGYLGADGLFHDLFLLALGYHDHRNKTVLGLDTGKRFQTTYARHVLVQENKVES